nr:hypothetical protein [Tanacetum cinerariifolium]
MYSFDLQNVVPSGDLTCLFAKASIDKSNLWYMRLGYVNFKTMNKLVKGNPQNGVAERKNRTLIEAAKTMLADSLLTIIFWAEAVNTACYVLNRALLTKSHNKTPYELLNGRTPRLNFIRPFGCAVTILNTFDPLGKFKGKADEGFLVGYSVTSKLLGYLILKPEKLKRICMLGNQTNKNAGLQDTNGNAGTQDNIDVGKEVSYQHYIVFLLWSSISSTFKILDDKAVDDKPKDDTSLKTVKELVNKEDQAYRDELERLMSQEKDASDAGNILRKENKKDEIGIVLRNKARLVAQGHRQEEGINYDEVFAPVAQIEAIRIFLAFTSLMGFIVYQMDVRSAFLYGKMEEEVYVSEPLGFIDPQFLNKVYKVDKGLYGLHQAPRAWYATLSNFLLQNGYRRGKIDKTLFIKKDKDDIMLVLVYVDDIIFGSTKKSLCDEFEALMHKR